LNLTKHLNYFLFTDRLAESDKNTTVTEKDRILQEKEAEIRHMQELLAVMQAQMQQQQP
jgi:septin 2